MALIIHEQTLFLRGSESRVRIFFGRDLGDIDIPLAHELGRSAIRAARMEAVHKNRPLAPYELAMRVYDICTANGLEPHAVRHWTSFNEAVEVHHRDWKTWRLREAYDGT